jgi:hypothetical protein
MRTQLRASALIALLFAGSACTAGSDAPVLPAEVQGRAPSHGLISSVLQLSLLQRLVPLAESYSAGATIGQGGGTISIPRAGVTVTFPAGAVATSTEVRVTAVAGSNVAYEFEPHGIVFQKPVVVTQELGLTQVVQNLLLAPTLEGAYYTQVTGGTAVVQEEIPASVDLLRLRLAFPIRHFSGYAVAQKKTGGYIASNGTRVPVGPTRR